ncbi:hypothetical protein D3C81_1896640 [compost metagenome]
MAEMIDKVSGSCTENLVPLPGLDSTATTPPRDSILVLTTSRPTPRPEMSEILSAVLKPEANRRAATSSSVIRSA